MYKELLLLFVALNHLLVHEKVKSILVLAFFTKRRYVFRVVRDAVGVQTRLAPGHVDINRVRWVNFEALRRELVGIGDHRLFEPHHLHQDGLPVLDIVSLLASGDQIFLVLVELAIFGIRTNISIFYAQVEEIRLVHIILHAKWQNFLHPFVPPFIERGRDKRCPADVHGQTFVHISMLVDHFFIVILLCRVFFARNFANARRPQEDGQNVLATLPAFVLFFRQYLPSCSSWEQMLET